MYRRPSSEMSTQMNNLGMFQFYYVTCRPDYRGCIVSFSLIAQLACLLCGFPVRRRTCCIYLSIKMEILCKQVGQFYCDLQTRLYRSYRIQFDSMYSLHACLLQVWFHCKKLQLLYIFKFTCKEILYKQVGWLGSLEHGTTVLKLSKSSHKYTKNLRLVRIKFEILLRCTCTILSSTQFLVSFEKSQTPGAH